MDPMQLLYHAAYLNDKGCAMMEFGKQHEAFETFIKAIESISTLTQLVEAKRHHQHRTLSLLPSRRSKQNQCVGAGNSLKSSDFILCDEKFEAGELSLNIAAGQASFVYNRAFRFTPRESHFERCDETAVHYLKLYQAGMTFNSALSFHQRSIGANESLKDTAETVAADLYLDAMNLLKDCFSTPDSCRILVATLNNAAILFYDMKIFDKFEVFQAELHRLLIDIESSFPKSVDPHYLQCFFFNATLLSTPKTAGAA